MFHQASGFVQYPKLPTVLKAIHPADCDALHNLSTRPNIVFGATDAMRRVSLVPRPRENLVEPTTRVCSKIIVNTSNLSSGQLYIVFNSQVYYKVVLFFIVIHQ